MTMLMRMPWKIVHLFLVLLTFVNPNVFAQTLHYGPPYSSTGDFLRPFGIAVDEAHGRLLVADTGNHRIKWTLIDDLSGAHVYTEHGYIADRSHADALNSPQAIAADSAGNIYVVNPLAGSVKLFTWNGGNYSSAQAFCSVTVDSTDILMPRDIAVGPDNAVYLLDSGNNRILKADGPADTAWSVFHSDSSWKNPYGLTVDSSGTIYVADTGNHRIVKIGASGVTTFGHWGTGRGEFRYPRDVAVDQHGRIYIADTFNHRIVVLAADGHHLIQLGQAPSISTINKVAVDSSDRVFVIDSDNNHALAYLGAGVPAQFDPFVRDHVGDLGSEPSDSFYSISSPDILIRHNPDVDLLLATANSLESTAFQQPLFNENNYVYLSVHNRGIEAAAESFVKVYWMDPAEPDIFPGNWNADGFFYTYTDTLNNSPGNTLPISSIDPGESVVIGPIIWRPPPPESATSGNGRFRLGIRVINPFDYPPTGDSVTFARDSNNVSERNLKVLRNPFSAGTQNTLVVTAHYPDVVASTDSTAIVSKITEMSAWIEEVSWGAANVIALQRGPVDLAQNSGYYNSESRNPLVELAQEVVDRVVVAEPGILDGSGPGNEIGRIIIVTNLSVQSREWATTGVWPFEIGGTTRYLSVSIHNTESTSHEFSHGLSHQLGMVDLYAHENVTFPFDYADGWDNMAQPFDGAHPLVWSKEHAYWVTSLGARILYIPRPQSGTTWNNGGNPIPLYYQENASNDQIIGIAFGLTNGVTSITDETAFYYVEARRNDVNGGSDHNVIPQTGILMYSAHSLIPQGHGPVIIKDHVAGGGLDDAAILVGGSASPDGTGITVTVQSGTSGADYNIEVTYAPPSLNYDVFMTRGDPVWLSPDIWIDNQANGYDEDAGVTPGDHGEQGIAGEENRVYARVSNAGPEDAYDVEVAYLFSEPYHTVDNVGDFDEFKSAFIDHIPAGGERSVFVTWNPVTGVNPHTCSQVNLRRLFDDTNNSNNGAQRNLQIDHSVHGSPYTPIEFTFQVGNKEGRSKKLVYFRADGVPQGWQWTFIPKKVYLSPGANATGILKLQPPQGAPDCTSHNIFVSGWTPGGDTLTRLGGAQLTVNLQNRTRIDAKVSIQKCKENRELCFALATTGCTSPLQPNQDIVVRYEGPDGEPHYRTVHTDGNGCYNDSFDVSEGGHWEVSSQFPGNQCDGPAATLRVLDVPLPIVEHIESDLPNGERRLCIAGISTDIEGRFNKPYTEKILDQACNAKASVQNILLKTKGTGLFDNDGGEIEISDLHHVLSSSENMSAGFHRGRFRWRTKEKLIVGTVVGLTNVGTHHKPTFVDRNEPTTLLNHWELSLDGIVVEGEDAGERLRAIVALDTTNFKNVEDAVLHGALEGVLEKDCLLSKEKRERRIRTALEKFRLPVKWPCGKAEDCLHRIAKFGKGETIIQQTGTNTCKGASQTCSTFKTWNELKVKLQGIPSVEGQRPFLRDGILTVKNLLQVHNKNEKGRGEHGGQFEYVSEDGTRVHGEMYGLTRAGTHRKPSHWNIDSLEGEGVEHMEGRLFGTVLNGKNKGVTVESRYVIQVPERENQTFQESLGKRKGPGYSRKKMAMMNLEGWGIVDCSNTAVGGEGPTSGKNVARIAD